PVLAAIFGRLVRIEGTGGREFLRLGGMARERVGDIARRRRGGGAVGVAGVAGRGDGLAAGRGLLRGGATGASRRRLSGGHGRLSRTGTASKRPTPSPPRDPGNLDREILSTRGSFTTDKSRFHGFGSGSSPVATPPRSSRCP